MEGVLRQVFADGSARSAAQFLAKYERAGRHDTERDKGVRAWDIERQAQSQSGDGSGAESANTKYGAYFCATLSPAEVYVRQHSADIVLNSSVACTCACALPSAGFMTVAALPRRPVSAVFGTASLVGPHPLLVALTWLSPCEEQTMHPQSL